MITPFDNNLNDRLKKIYISFEDYQKDFNSLKDFFLKKHNESDPSFFIEEEIRRYSLFLDILNYEEVSVSLTDMARYRETFKSIYEEIDPVIKESKQLSIEKYDQDFVRVSFKQILSYLKGLKLDNQNKFRQIKQLDFKLKSSEVVYLFRLLSEAEYIDNPKLEKGLWKWLEESVTSNGKAISNPLQLENSYKNNNIGKPQGYKKMLISLKEKIDNELS